MKDKQCNSLEDALGDNSKCNSENFRKPDGVNYVPVSRPGWGDVGMNGGGDPDSVDYRDS